jgi:hypothetical protein
MSVTLGTTWASEMIIEIVGLPRKSPMIDTGKNCHLATYGYARDTDMYVECSNRCCGFPWAVTSGQKSEKPRLPKAEEHDQLDAKQLQKSFVWGDVLLELRIELYEKIHGDYDRGALQKYNPQMTVFGSQG